MSAVKRDIERMFAPAVIRQAYRQIDMAAASRRPGRSGVLDHDRSDRRARRHDLIVFDTAPTGHTELTPHARGDGPDPGAGEASPRALLRIDRIGASDDEQFHLRDPVLAALERRRERLKRLRDRVFDRGSTSFVLVTIPERLAIEETARAAELLSATGIDVGALIVNRVLPDDLEGEFYRSRKAQEAQYLLDRGAVPRLRRADVRQLARRARPGVADVDRLTLRGERARARNVRFRFHHKDTKDTKERPPDSPFVSTVPRGDALFLDELQQRAVDESAIELAFRLTAMKCPPNSPAVPAYHWRRGPCRSDQAAGSTAVR
jgi:hypothetical protein